MNSMFSFSSIWSKKEPGHANGLRLMATDAEGDVIASEVYYSIGGGFVLTEAELARGKDTDEGPAVPHPFKSAAEMLRMARQTGLSIAEMKRARCIRFFCIGPRRRSM